MEGIDVSTYQGNIDWEKVKTDFVYIKMSQGIKAHDKRALEYAAGATKYNIPFGYYHFATLNSTDVLGDCSLELADVLAQLKTLPKAPLAFALDVETDEALLAPDQVELWIKTFFDGMTAAGFKMILYSGLYYLNSNLGPDHQLGHIPLWIAEYTNGKNPILPRGWKDYAIWQYSSTGNVLGIAGKVDLNSAKVLI